MNKFFFSLFGIFFAFSLYGICFGDDATYFPYIKAIEVQDDSYIVHGENLEYFKDKNELLGYLDGKHIDQISTLNDNVLVFAKTYGYENGKFVIKDIYFRKKSEADRYHSGYYDDMDEDDYELDTYLAKTNNIDIETEQNVYLDKVLVSQKSDRKVEIYVYLSDEIDDEISFQINGNTFSSKKYSKNIYKIDYVLEDSDLSYLTISGIYKKKILNVLGYDLKKNELEYDIDGGNYTLEQSPEKDVLFDISIESDAYLKPNYMVFELDSSSEFVPVNKFTLLGKQGILLKNNGDYRLVFDLDLNNINKKFSFDLSYDLSENYSDFSFSITPTYLVFENEEGKKINFNPYSSYKVYVSGKNIKEKCFDSSSSYMNCRSLGYSSVKKTFKKTYSKSSVIIEKSSDYVDYNLEEQAELIYNKIVKLVQKKNLTKEKQIKIYQNLYNICSVKTSSQLCVILSGYLDAKIFELTYLR